VVLYFYFHGGLYRIIGFVNIEKNPAVYGKAITVYGKDGDVYGNKLPDLLTCDIYSLM
jgi:hypothetical protein